jgi:hypothetical protein
MYLALMVVMDGRRSIIIAESPEMVDGAQKEQRAAIDNERSAKRAGNDGLNSTK